MNLTYETESALQSYLLFHYGNAEEQLPWVFGPREALFYPVRCVEEFAAGLGSIGRALDLGCAVGRSTFELTRFSESVVGIDLSQRFIETAEEIRQQGSVTIRRTLEGHRFQISTHELAPGIDRDRCRFEVGDALHLREDLGRFDFVLAANLLDRVPDPRKLLRTLAELTSPGGHCLLASPYTWLEEFTPESHWLGAGSEADEGTWPALQAEMLENFELIQTKDLPFLIGETARKYQWSVAQAGLWKRRSACSWHRPAWAASGVSDFKVG